MKGLLSKLRYALRQFRRSPVFTAAAILTLALGIGGTTAIFTLIHAVMLRSLPVSDPGRLYRVGEGDGCCIQGGPQDRWGFYSYPLYERLKENTPEFEEVAAFQATTSLQSVRREGETAARPLLSEYVTGSYFSMLGVRAFGGRLLTPEDDREGAPPVAVLGHRAWQTRYGSDPNVVGSTFIIEGHPFTITGVTPPGFFGETLRSDPPDLWIPVQQEPLIDGEGALLHQSIAAWLRMMGRLKPGASIAGMAPRLTGVLRQWMRHDSGYPANWMPDIIHSLPKQFINVIPAGAGVAEMKEEYGRSLQILLAVCGLVLLIACANVANLLLARAASRRGQTAVRLAIGATRRQIIGQALTESVLLAIGGGVVGLLVAVGAARLLLILAFQSAHFLPISPVPSPGVLACCFALALVTGTIFGAVPAWFATRTDPAEALRGAGRSTRDHSHFTRTGLLVVQATLSVVLVAGATMQRMELPDIQRLRQFKGSLSVLLISLLFVLLAADLKLPLLWHAMWEGLALFAILALVVRPLSAWLSCLGSDLSWKQVLFIGAIAPRGVVAAAIVSLFAIILQDHGRADAQTLQSLVYIIIVVSVMVYGFLAAPMSRWLDIRGADDRSVLIVGGRQVGVELARVLGEDREVRFIDLNAEAVATMQRGGYLALRGNVLDPLYMELAHAEEVSAVLAMTASSDQNLLIARMAHEDFHVPEVYITLPEGDAERHASLIHQLQARRLFAAPYSYSYWNAEVHRKRLIHENRVIEPGSPLIGLKLFDVRIASGAQPLAVMRKGKSLIPHDDIILQEDDTVSMLVRPERVQEGQPLILPPVSDKSLAGQGQRLPG